MKLKVLDVFAGCGGLSYGLTEAGHSVIAACEVDKWAAETYALNHPQVSLFNCGIQELGSDFLRSQFRGEVDLVTGGPPCQGFSVSGKRQYGVRLEKNQRIYDFVRVVDAVRPSFFLMENVKGFTSATINGSMRALETVVGMLQNLGYHVYHDVLQAANYGIPQLRSRIFIVGSLVDLPFSPFPPETHSAEGSKTTKPYLCVTEAISDLPAIGAGEGTNGAQPYTSPATNQYQRDMRLGSQAIYNHEAMKHTKRLVERFARIPSGGSGYRIGRSHSKSTEEVTTVYKMNNQRLVGNLPSLCITANFQSNYIHPTLNRNLTAREAARIMSFPDRFIFKGNRTAMSSSLLMSEGRVAENYLSQYNQIGNAVPPSLAKLIGEHLAESRSGRVGPKTFHGTRAYQLGLLLRNP
jgi:DNA (cytosine-5)-methyltransferase 1